MQKVTALIVACLFTQASFGQAWSGIIHSDRAIDWTFAGASIIDRTNVCANVAAGASAATINAAIDSAPCASGGVVLLSAGTYNLTAGIQLDKNNITLRGAGADQTFISVSGSGAGCGGYNAGICVWSGASIWYQDWTTANWTGGLSVGSTTLTLSNTSGLQVGKLIMLTQVADGSKVNDRPDGVFVCDSPDCASQGYGNSCCGTDNDQTQFVRVTAINGNQVSISPSVYMPNWRSERSPRALWGSALPITGVGIEDLSLDATSMSGNNGITFGAAYNSWVKGIRLIKPFHHHVKIAYSKNITVRDSYFFEGQTHASESYGIDIWGASDSLVENNIFQRVTNGMMNEGGSGMVWGYNYSTDNIYSQSDWLQAAMYTHSTGNNYQLWEGNDTSGMTLDNIWGSSHFMTMFRNRSAGYDVGRAGLTAQTIPSLTYAWNRHANVIGNVLGLEGYHSNYEASTSTGSTNCNVSIFAIGFQAHCSANVDNDDPRVRSTMMRWGNYDTVNDAARWVSAEVPSGQTYFPNAVPSSQTLPASFYLPSKPAWFGDAPYPATGPDVNAPTGEANVGNHNAKNPARRCAESIGVAIGQSTARAFNADTCYYATAILKPNPPTDVVVTHNWSGPWQLQ